jgi:hypothetical protein
MGERKFAALANIRKRAEVDAESDAQSAAFVQPPPSTPVQTDRGRGRPPGKRSDPEWKPRTILMRTKTHRRAAGLLLNQDNGPDLSELVDQLLSEWLDKQAKG